MNIDIKCTNVITKYMEKTSILAKSVVLCQFFASLTLTMTFKMLFKTFVIIS